jgi:hypothetical protein
MKSTFSFGDISTEKGEIYKVLKYDNGAALERQE